MQKNETSTVKTAVDPDVNDVESSGGTFVTWMIAGILLVAAIIVVPMLVNLIL